MGLKKWLKGVKRDKKNTYNGFTCHPASFDKLELLEQIEGNKALYDTLISTALEILYPQYLNIKNAYLEKKYSEVKQYAHKINGSALSMCCNNLAGLAKNIESLPEYDNNKLSDLIENLEREWYFVKEIFEKELSSK
jgi:HPt (histidine-containing phosphotransfer) domain-containing protein